MTVKIDKKTAKQIVNTVKDVCGQDINFINKQGIIYASTIEERLGCFHEVGLEVAKTGIAIEVKPGEQFEGTQEGVNIPVFHNGMLLSVIGIMGEPHKVRGYAYLAVRITQLLIREQELEAFNRSLREKNGFIIRTLLKGEITNPDYLSECLTELEIDDKEEYRIIVIKRNINNRTINLSTLEQKINRLMKEVQTSLFTYDYPNEYIVVMRDKKLSYALERLQPFAEIHKESITIGIGTKQRLYHLSESYESAEIAVKSIEGVEKGLALFENLDLEMIIGGLDLAIKRKYKEKTIQGLSDEDKQLLKVYYEENMSLSAAGQKLFLHKNTLQYKLNRIKKITGYNPRVFRDAVILYMAIYL